MKMACLDVGTLRSFLDEEQEPGQRLATAAHLDQCAACREELARLTAQREAAATALAALAPGEGELSPPAFALRAWHQRRAAHVGLWQRLQGGIAAMNENSWWRSWRSAAAALAVVAVVAGVVFTPAGTVLGDWLSVFRAEKFAPVTIDPSKVDSASAPKLDPAQMGEFKVKVEPQHKQVANLAAAQGTVDFKLRGVGSLPAGLAAQPEVYTTTTGDVTYVFNLAKTKAALAAQGINVQLPADLDGATVRVYVPASVQMLYKSGDDKSGLFFYQGRSPTLELPGALDTPQMRDLFFQLSGLPPELIDQLKAMSQSNNTVPVPVLQGDSSKTVAVDGTQGLLVDHKPTMAGDGAPAGSYLVWQKDGVVYLLGGTVSATDLQNAAKALK
jgi:hypothetical protein